MMLLKGGFPMIGERIKKIRKDKDLTQQEFAEKIGVKRNTVATYEMGRSMPSDSALSLICKTFNVNEEWLRDGTGEIYQPEATAALELLAIEHNLTNGEYVLIEKFLKLKPDVRTALVRYVREVAASIVNDEADGLHSEEPVMPDAAETGAPLTDAEIKRRAALYTEMAQQSARRELQRAGVDPEIEAEVEAYRQRRIQEKKQASQTSVAKERGAG